jgi:hypothetical protein
MYILNYLGATAMQQSFNRIVHRSLAMALMLLCALSVSGCVEDFSDVAFEGVVVDIDTEQPVAGVHVYGYVQLWKTVFMQGRYPDKVVHRFHTVTDAQGRWSKPAWKTRIKPDGAVVPPEGYDKYSGYSFKPGYVHVTASSQRDDNKDKVFVKGYVKRIDPDDYVRRFNELLTSYDGTKFFDCAWEVYAPLLRAQDEELHFLKRRILPPDRRDEYDSPDSGYYRSEHPGIMGDGLTARSFVVATIELARKGRPICPGALEFSKKAWIEISEKLARDPTIYPASTRPAR